MKKLTEAQRAAAKARREKFRVYVKKLASMPEADRLQLAARLPALATVEGHVLSLHNQILVAMQKPDATLVGGFRQWKQHGRAVKKGEHGIMIWVPVMPGSGDEDIPQPDEVDGKSSDDRPRFIMGTVFDVSQTCEIGDAGGAGANQPT